MIETLEITINNKKYNYSKDITLQEIYMEHQGEFRFPIILAKVNNRLKELSATLTESATVEFIDLTTSEGNRAHLNGLIFILQYAVKKLFGKNSDILVQHSLDKGLYIDTNFKLSEEKLLKIKEVMIDIITKDLPITKVTIDRIEAINYFKEIGDFTKAGVLRYNTNNYITLYRLGNIYNYFYNLMPTSTGKVKDFDLTYIKDNGFVLRFPTVYINNKIQKYKHHPHMFEAFAENKEWAKIIGVRNSVELNKVVSTGKINDLIKIDETLQSNRLLSVAKEINAKKNKVKIVLIAGPSSSGKTTTSRKLCMYLKSFGLEPKTIGMDDYFVEKEETPLDENNNPDFECLEAVDLKLFDKQMANLLSGKNVKIPTYNFSTGKKEYHNEMQLEEKDILIIEGIHALDNKILTNIDRSKKFKIYISPLTELNLDDQNRIPTTDNRLLRRIVRDNRTRNYSVEKTLKQWPSVRLGEEKYIFPFQDESDVTINSAAIYEIGVLKTYVEPLLYSVESTSPYYEEAKRLINFLRLFLPIPADAIPQDAVIREFIGGSYFHE
ncbi:MAG: nucleoside kinase [Bacilli bacterium]|nr:nucleoside kinase [Bacilli bacterium]